MGNLPQIQARKAVSHPESSHLEMPAPVGKPVKGMEKEKQWVEFSPPQVQVLK